MSLTFDEAEKEMRAFFNTGWASATAIAWPDEKFTPPDGAIWVRYNSTETDGFQATMGSPGSNRFQHIGLVTVQLFAPQGDASIDIRAKADDVLAIFMGKETTNNIHFYNVQVRQIGNDGAGLYQINVIASFRYDQIT